MARIVLFVVLLIVVSPQLAWSDTFTLNFDGFTDLQVLGVGDVAGLNFINALVLQSGVLGGSLNEFDFPPRSDFNVVSDSGGAMTLNFSSTVVEFSGYFTYNEMLTMEAFDGATSLGSVSSLFTENFTFSGGTPNELLSLNLPGGFTSIVITGNAAGGSFVMDDITWITGGTVVPVSAPGTVGLFALGSVLFAADRRRRNKSLMT